MDATTKAAADELLEKLAALLGSSTHVAKCTRRCQKTLNTDYCFVTAQKQG